MGKKIGEEITQKIKSAVKAKLIELGVEVDNELPDYIMVLVANKKTQAQMENDLQLFLGANTFLFTTWLVNVLKKLEEVTVSKKNYKGIEVTNQGGGVIVTKKEEDYDKRKAIKLAARVKLEPGTSQSENEPAPPGEENDEADNRNEREASNELESYESENEEVEKSSKDGVGEDNECEASNIPEKSQVAGPIDGNISAQKPLGSPSQSDSEAVYQDAEFNDDASETLETRERDESLDKEEFMGSSHSKVLPNSQEEVLENGNNLRGNSDKFLDDTDKELSSRNRRDSWEDRRYDDKRRSVENEFYRGADRLRSHDDDYPRSPDDNRFRSGGRRSPGYDRFRDSGRRSPINNRYRDSRRSYENDRNRSTWRRSPDNRRKNYDDNRRSPGFRRRSPLSSNRGQEYGRRSPFKRRRSLEDRYSPNNRRRSPIDRRRSPIGRRRSPVDRRRLYSDRDNYNDKPLPGDKGRAKVLDAREILKRKNRLKELTPSHNSEDDEPKRRRVLASMVHKPDDSRREKSIEPQIPSLVRVTPRPVRNEAIQPNKKLLLLAVADAEKSIVRKPTVTVSSRKRFVTRRSEERNVSERRTSVSSNSSYIPPEKIFITLTNNRSYSERPEETKSLSREVSTRKLYQDVEMTLEDDLLYENNYFDYEQNNEDASGEKEEEYVPQIVVFNKNAHQSLKSKLLSDSKCIISLESSPERSCDEWENKNEIYYKTSSSLNNITKKLRDVLSDNNNSAVDITEDKFEWNRLGPAPVATVKPLAQGSVIEEKYKGEAVHKALERCRFWPNCLSEICIYFHPSAPCQMFPACKSGKDCLFIHPDCRFGLGCLNPKCIFIHREINEKKKAVEVIVSAPELPVEKPSPLIKCVYFPKCKNLNCKFWHPVKNCKYGNACARSDCYFFHPTLVVPPKELLTWTPKI